ncbi:MAG TPA: type II toxin-antitoxin system VapC family toxin [Ideonella sp.]|nr:type II toxin-antitoxin system VapC family toxin [Ideonella sp.]
MTTRYLLDTNIWIYIMRNRPPEVRSRFSQLKRGAVVMSPVVLGELHVGWRKSRQAQANQALLDAYLATADIDPLDADVASAYGEIRAALETSGTPIGANDLWIGAHARQRGWVLVTHNLAEFERIPGLQVEDWVQT